ncbi:MAG: sigma 54-interacting transcriptional regulator [Planctomycetota bacterium]
MDRPESKPMHPVIAAFVGSDRTLKDILHEASESRDRMVQAMVALRNFLSGECPWEEALAVAERVRIADHDPCLAILFLGLWAGASRRIGRNGEVVALVGLQRSLFHDGMPPEIHVAVLNSEAFRCAALGDRIGEARITEDLSRSLPRESPRYPVVFMGCATALASRWRAFTIEGELGRIAAMSPRYRSLTGLVHLIQYAETGRIQEARGAIVEVGLDPEMVRFHARQLSGNRIVLDLMESGGGATGRDAAGGDDAGAVTRLLLARRTVEALETARRKALEEPGRVVNDSDFFAFDLIRAELAAGRGEAARRLIAVRRNHGNVHLLDEFFVARTELLAGRGDRARRLFAAAWTMLEKYRALGRLTFELRLACEIPAGAGFPAGPYPSAGGSAEEIPVTASEPGRRGINRLIGISPAIAGVRELVGELARANAPLLVRGEVGTGKRLIGRILHEAGPRAEAPFIVQECAGIAEGILSAELFGYVAEAVPETIRAYAGVFERAGDGMVMLYEIEHLPAGLQMRFLEVLESGEIPSVGNAPPVRIGCRVVVTTVADIAALAAAGRFRPELARRLSRFSIAIPPLRERREDIVALAEEFLSGGRADGRRVEIAPRLAEDLAGRDWPGNAEELRDVMERMRLADSEKPAYDVADIERVLKNRGGTGSSPEARVRG